MVAEAVQAELDLMKPGLLEEYKERARPLAANGVMALNEAHPAWFLEIDTEKLDIYSPDNCVLGQLYGRWTYGPPGLLGTDHGVKRGFNVGNTMFGAALTMAWIEEIDRLREIWDVVGGEKDALEKVQKLA